MVRQELGDGQVTMAVTLFGPIGLALILWAALLASAGAQIR